MDSAQKGQAGLVWLRRQTLQMVWCMLQTMMGMWWSLSYLFWQMSHLLMLRSNLDYRLFIPLLLCYYY